MTLQVGLVGTDGVVLASDTKWSERSRREIRHTFDRSKITVNFEQRIAVSAARNMESSMRAARKIADEIKTEEWTSPELRIQEIAEQAMNSLAYNVRDVNCLIVSPQLRLYQLETTIDLGVSEQRIPICAEHTDRACAGDDLNNALFFGERYYKRQSTSELVPLAAHLIITASKLSPDRIDGLEIVVCSKNGFSYLPEASIRELNSMSDRLDAYLRESLCRPLGDTP